MIKKKKRNKWSEFKKNVKVGTTLIFKNDFIITTLIIVRVDITTLKFSMDNKEAISIDGLCVRFDRETCKHKIFYGDRCITKSLMSYYTIIN